VPTLAGKVALVKGGAVSMRALALAALLLAATDARAERLPPDREALGALTYPGLLEDGTPVTLRDGRWLGPPSEPGLASRPSAALIPWLLARGDLDRDGREDVVVFLQTSFGGSGVFLHLAAVLDRPEGLVPLPAVLIGDRAEVEAIQVIDDRIVLDAVVAGPGDAACCPSQRVRRTYTVANGALLERSSERRGRFRIRSLAGTSWRLTRFDAATPVPDDAGIVLHFEGGRVSGSGGCNPFRAEVLSGERDAVQIGPIASGRRSCPAPVMERERRFFEALGRATRIGFWFGRLEIQYDTPQRRIGRLHLAPLAPE